MRSRVPIAKQALQSLGMRELRRCAKPAVAGIEGSRQELARGLQRRIGQLYVHARRRRREIGERAHERLILLAQVGFVVAVVVGDLAEQVLEGREAITGFLRKVRAAEERPLIVAGQEHGQRPAAGALREHLLGNLVDAVDIGALFAVDLDVHEAAIQHLGGRFILEALVREHVTPMARGVTDAQVNRLVLIPRTRKGFRPPGIPVDGIVRMLLQVGAGLGDQAIGVLRGAVVVDVRVFHQGSPVARHRDYSNPV